MENSRVDFLNPLGERRSWRPTLTVLWVAPQTARGAGPHKGEDPGDVPPLRALVIGAPV